MKTKHTPGPWDFFHDEKEQMISIAEQGFDRNDDSDDRSVCGIWGLNGMTRSDDENFANARLITAAPDLLEALEELQEKWISADHYWGSSTNKKVEHAIKKARGL